MTDLKDIKRAIKDAWSTPDADFDATTVLLILEDLVTFIEERLDYD